METLEVAAARSLRWYEIWWEVYRHPSEKTFIRILSDPGVSSNRVYLWVAAIGVLIGIVVTTRPTIEFDWVRLISFMIGGPILACLVATFGTLILHWYTNILGGQGDYGRLFFILAAIICPVYLAELVLMVLFSSTSILGSLILFVIVLYALYLVLLALKSVAKLTAKRVLLAVIVPLLLIGGFVSCMTTWVSLG